MPDAGQQFAIKEYIDAVRNYNSELKDDQRGMPSYPLARIYRVTIDKHLITSPAASVHCAQPAMPVKIRRTRLNISGEYLGRCVVQLSLVLHETDSN